jgi:hypothetical protein
MRATHTIRVAPRAPRRSLRSSHLAELAGRSCPHRWPRSGLLHPGGPRREIRRRCHLIVTSTRTSTRKTVELRGFEPLTFCMPYRAGPSPDGAGRRHTSRSPAVILARCGLTLPGACRRWLPTWLPVNSSAALTPAGRTGCRPAAAPETGGDDLPRPSPRSTRLSSGPPTRAWEYPAPRSVDSLLRY